MLLNDEFRDMLCAFAAESVEYLLVGAHALAAHGLPRATGDMDLWIAQSEENARRVWAALERFGAPLSRISQEDLNTADVVFQIGLPPFRIDILTSIDGVVFDDALLRCRMVKIGELNIPVISREDLITNKLAVGRPQDLADVDRLRNLRG